MFSGCMSCFPILDHVMVPQKTLFQLSFYASAHVCIICEISLGTSRGLNWENKTYKLKRSIVSTKNVNFKDEARVFGVGENDPL